MLTCPEPGTTPAEVLPRDSPMDPIDESIGPIFIFAALNRSGTNLVSDVLSKHPDFAIPQVMWEDYLLKNVKRLDQYLAETSRHWGRGFREREEVCLEHLRSSLGGGILRYLSHHTESRKRPVLKTPRPDNMNRLFDFFPGARMLIVLRDGRDVVESAARTFSYRKHKHWMELWRHGARIVLDFMEEFPPQRAPWHCVRFEELVADPEPVVRSVLDFVGANAATYPFDDLKAMPVRGSSTERGGAEETHWRPVEKPAGFNPVGRWRDWGALRRRQFKSLCGAELGALGYANNEEW